MTPKTLPKSEWVFATALAVLTAVLLLLPYALGYATQDGQNQFTGLVMNPEDSQTYFAKMLQGYNGRLFYTIPFTPEPHQGALVGSFYVALGHLARLVGMSIITMWHGSRFLAGLGMFLTTYWFITQFIPDRQTRTVAYWLALYGSGLGWLLFVLGQTYWLGAFPVDFKEPEAHLFFTALTFPHVAVGTALTLVSVQRLWQMGQKTAVSWPAVCLTGFVHLLVGIAYPFLLYLSMMIAGLYWLVMVWQQKRVVWLKTAEFALTFLIPAPLYLYYAYTLQTNPVFKAWDVQAATPSFPWPHYLVAYGVMLLLAVGGRYWRSEIRDSTTQYSIPNTLILWLWLAAVALLLYAPLNPQRRFVQGVHVPLSILAAVGFVQWVLPWFHRRRWWQALIKHPRYSTPGLNRFVTMLFVLLMSLSNLYLLTDVSRIAAITHADPLFRPSDEVEAVAWLQEHVPQTAVILGDYQTGNYIAAQAGQRVMVGHWAETMAYEAKLTAVSQFYNAATSDEWRRNLLTDYGITHVWFGPREQVLGGFDPKTADYLHPQYTNETITIFAVQP